MARLVSVCPLVLLAACTPGISVNAHDVTTETLVVVQSFADSEESHRILSGEEKTVGEAAAWSIGARRRHRPPARGLSAGAGVSAGLTRETAGLESERRSSTSRPTPKAPP